MSETRYGRAILSNRGALAIGTHTPKADYRDIVDELNADMLDGVHGDKMLRTDEDRTVNSETTVTLEGTMEVPGLVNVTAGEIRVGEFKLEATSNGGVSIGFK